MQANRGGVCKECGMEYDIDAIRAMIGANHTPPAPAAVTAPAPTVRPTDEIDREALLVYLNDVRVMETIIRKTSLAKTKANNALKALHDKLAGDKKALDNIAQINENNKEVKIKKSANYDAEIKNLEKTCKIAKVVKIFLICLSVLMVLGILSVIEGLIEDSPGMTVFVLILDVFPLAFGIWWDKASVEKLTALIESKSIFLEQMKKKTDENENLIHRQSTAIETLKKEVDAKTSKTQDYSLALDKDISQVSALLKKAYSANIIPLQFRNIQGVYYLYDYLSTSNQTLSEALMQCNLEAIKQKLDKMIQLQSEQIVQQAIANAKLGQIYEVAEATMNNTAVAAKYAQIAATNSEITKRLSKKQLAYQTADFWLK